MACDEETDMRTGTETPWGPAQTMTRIAAGITAVTTSSHGGIRLSVERQARMPARYAGLNVYGGGLWYEEDCEWCMVALAFPEYFSDCVEEARGILKHFYDLEWKEGTRRKWK